MEARTVEKNEYEVSDLDLEHITRLITEGYMSGIWDNEGYRISWNIRIDKFKNK